MRNNRFKFILIYAVLCLSSAARSPIILAQSTVKEKPATSAVVDFVDTSIENGSPLWYEFDRDGTLLTYLMYDHERSSPNRAAGHFHFKIVGKPNGSVRLELKNLDNVWNGNAASVASEIKSVVVSEDDRTWKSIGTDVSADNRVTMELTLSTQGELYVARVEPYRVSDLDKLIERIRDQSLVKIVPIGKTYDGQSLDILQIGKADAPYRVFLRARAHPWEAGGNWIVEGLIARLLEDDAVARRCLEKYCVYILPMANKDGVARGRTRFNMQGKDLNRNWDKPADAALAPENAALEKWLESMIAQGMPPHLALELHNDGNGKLHISRPPVAKLDQHVERMRVLESLLRRYTWFTEGSTDGAFRKSGTLGDGWFERYGIDSAVHEFNCHWIAGLKERPLAKHWKNYGEQLVLVFEDYFETVKP